MYTATTATAMYGGGATAGAAAGGMAHPTAPPQPTSSSAPYQLPPHAYPAYADYQQQQQYQQQMHRKTSSTSTATATRSPSRWAPDPAIGHLLNTMRKVGPKSQNHSGASPPDPLDLAAEADADADDEEEFEFLEQLLQSRELNALVKAHNVILFCNQEQCPCVSNACQIAADVMEDVRPYALMLEECRELYAILTTPHIRNLMASHDIVAQRDYLPKLQDIPVEVDEDEETIKIVQLVKSQEPLGDGKGAEPIVGATIKAEDGTSRILIARVMHGGAADRSGLISVGDEVIEVNGINVEGRTPNDVLKILQMAENTITFKLIPNENKPMVRESRIRLRALFNYDPMDDMIIPCKEAGLPFTKGDIIHIVSQDDPYWWQARREQDRHMRAGLIPSRALQERRIIQERDEMMKAAAAAQDDTMNESEDFDREEIATYEEVARLFPRAGTFRPVVLVGPPGVGRNEIKRRIVAMEPDRFRTTIPHTSRPPRPGEMHGKDYFFDTRAQMQADIDAGKYLEHGEFKGNLYGTSVDGLRELIEAGLQPVLTPHYQALKMLRTPDLKPYIIYVKAPPFQTLKETRHQAYARSTFAENCNRAFTDEEFRTMLKAGERMEFWYGHWFDLSVTNDDLGTAFEKVVRAVQRLDQDAQWVPAAWVQ